MSTKTLRKRIALVAVSAMGFGLLTSVSANATIGVNNVTFTAATAQPGVCAVDNTSGATSAVVVAGSSVQLTATVTGSTYLSLSGNGTFSSPDSTWDTVTLTTAYEASNASAQKISVTTGAVGTATVTTSDTSSGSAVDKLTISIVAACASGVFDSAESYFQAMKTSSGSTAATSNVDETYSGNSAGNGGRAATLVANGSEAYIGMLLRDAYDNALPAGKALVATVKSGDAYVSIASGSTAAAAGNGKTAIVSSIASGYAKVTVSQGTPNTPTTAVVEVTYNGVVVGSRTFTFEGPAAKINISDVTSGKTGGSGYYRYTVQDSAGNYLRDIALANDAAVTDGAIVSSGRSSSADTTGHLGEKSDAASGTNPATFSCSGKGGVGTAGVKYKDTKTLATIKASFSATCGGALDTWTLSMDKASYAPGEIATLTVTGKDAAGNPVNSTDTISTVTYSFGGMTFVTAPTEADKFTSGVGVKKYTLSVGTTEGSFVGTFKIAGSTDDSAKTIQYKVAASGASISNAEVLAAIVKLIASINKQIAALQKLLTKKK